MLEDVDPLARWYKYLAALVNNSSELLGVIMTALIVCQVHRSSTKLPCKMTGERNCEERRCSMDPNGRGSLIPTKFSVDQLIMVEGIDHPDYGLDIAERC